MLKPSRTSPPGTQHCTSDMCCRLIPSAWVLSLERPTADRVPTLIKGPPLCERRDCSRAMLTRVALCNPAAKKKKHRLNHASIAPQTRESQAGGLEKRRRIKLTLVAWVYPLASAVVSIRFKPPQSYKYITQLRVRRGGEAKRLKS